MNKPLLPSVDRSKGYFTYFVHKGIAQLLLVLDAKTAHLLIQ